MKKRFKGAASTPVAHAENPRNRVGAPREASQDQMAPEKPNRPRNANARLLATIEASVDCVITIDAHSTILEFNAAAERTFGYAREKVIGKPLTEMIIPPSLREAHQRGMAALLKGGTGKLLGKRVEMPAMRSDGSEFPVELTVTQIAGQAPPIFTAYLRDITDRIRAEEALNAQALRYKTLMETSTDSIYLMDEKGDLQEANAAFLRRRGYTAEEVKGLNVADWDGQWSREQLQQRLRMLVGSSAVFETRHRCKDGSVFDVEVCGTSVLIGGEKLFFCVTRDITQRKQAEKQALALIDAIPQQIWSGPPDGTLDYCNARWRSYMGIGLKDLQGDGWQTMLHPNDRDRVLKAWHDSVLNGKPFEQEERHLGADGKYRWFLARGVPLRDTEGRIVRWYGTNTDIEDRKQAEEAVRRGEKLFAAFMNHLPGFAWMKDIEGRYVYVNKKELELDPYRDGAIGKTDAELWPAEIASAYRANDHQVITTRKAVQTVEPSLANGERSYMLVTKFPIFDQGGLVVMVAGAGVDITDLTQAKEALNAQALRYKTLMETSTDSIYVVDEKGDLQEANAAFLRQRGYTAEEVKGLNVADWDAQWSREQVRERMRNLVDSSAVFETRHRCKDGSLFDAEVSVTSVRIGGEQLFFCVTRDITERKNAERALRESEERFRELAENINEVFWVWTAAPVDPRLLYVSPAYATIWGRSCESLYCSPQSWKEALHPDDKKWVLAEIAHPDLGKVNDLSYRIVRPDQSIRWIRDRIFPVRDRSGVVVRFAGIAEDVTESKTIAEALESAEEQYRSIFNNAVDGIFRTSPDGKFLVANPAAARIFGFGSPEELIEERQDIAQQGYVDPRRREEFKRLIQEEGVVNGFEYEAYRKDGSRVWISENTRLVHSSSGETLYFEGILEDITNRKLAEEALRESEERFRTIFEQAPLGISEGEIATAHFISANQRYLDILGYTIDELRKLTFRDYTHPDDLQKDLAEFQKLAAGEIRTYAMEKRYIRKDGAIIWVSLTVTGLASPGEKPLNCIAVIEDITDRVQAEEKLRRSEEKFKTLFGIAPVGISVLDRQHNVIDANPALEQITRLRREELLKGTNPHRRVLKADGTPMLPNELPSERAMAENRPIYDAEAGIVMENGEIIWVQVSVAPLALPDASAVVITQDITERKRAAKDLEDANYQLRVLSRQLFHIQEEERRHLARELHDEIGQTLTAAKINLKIIAPDVPAKVTGRLDDSVQLLDRLLRQVRELSLDLRPPLLDELGLVPTLRWLVDHQAQRAGLRVTFTATVNDLEIDPDVQTTCFRVAQEAITNIIRHSGAKNVAVELGCEAERLTLSVRDDGTGFDPAVIQKKNPHDFTLGLVSMKERALLVRGGFEVQSAPGQGTEIRAWFPLPFEENSSTKESA